jgi:hypothetical protein
MTRFDTPCTKVGRALVRMFLMMLDPSLAQAASGSDHVGACVDSKTTGGAWKACSVWSDCDQAAGMTTLVQCRD